MTHDLELVDSGSPAILRVRSWIYAALIAILLIAVVGGGDMRVGAMLPASVVALIVPRVVSPNHRVYCALAADTAFALISWWLLGPSAGTDFVLLIIAALAGLIYDGSRRNWLVGAVLVVELAQIPLHFLAESTQHLPLFHSPSQVVSDSEFVAGVLLRAGLLFLASVLLAVVGTSFRRLVRSKDEFVASVSHELRTPLTAVVGFSSVLESSWRDLPEEELDQLIHDISRQSGEVSSIVEDLLVIARADIGAVTLIPARLSLGDEAGSVLAGIGGTGGKKITLDCDSCVVWADPVRFRQVLRNLLANALRYGGDQIRVSSRTTGATVHINVEDNGDGVDGDPEQMFEPYVRAHENPTQPASVGLGLAVSRSLARAMGGDLVYRRAGGVTAFVLTVPTAPVSQPDPVASVPERTGVAVG